MAAEMQYRRDMSEAERREADEIAQRISSDGRLYQADREGNLLLDAAGKPVPAEFVVLRGRRWLVDSAGTVWRFLAEGTRKNPNAPDGGGAPWRNNRVEMWTGRWRRVVGADGEVAYRKALAARPIDKRINGHPGMSQIDWYRNVKGYRHPHDPPDAPTAEEIRALEGRRSVVAAEVGARLDAELAKTEGDTK